MSLTKIKSIYTIDSFSNKTILFKTFDNYTDEQNILITVNIHY